MKKSLQTLFTLTPLLASEADIQLQTCYGNPHEIIVEGRILEERRFRPSSLMDSWLVNGWRKLKQLINDEIETTPITLTIEEEQYHTISDDEGYFRFQIHNPHAPWKPHQNIMLHLDEYNVTIHASAFIVEASIEVGIISDFDDTVIISGVTNTLDLIKNLLFKNYKQRTLVKEVRDKILQITQAHPKTPLFFVTGSPRQLYGSIHDFLNHHHFPKRTLITKKAHGANPDPLFDQLRYKLEKIEELIRLYPHIQWICFGDSGEKDAKVYKTLHQKYPQKIRAIYIREVESGELKSLL